MNKIVLPSALQVPMIKENDCYTIWEMCLKVIREEVPEQTYQTWFEPVVPYSLEDQVLTIRVPNKFFYEWLEEHHVFLLRKAINSAIGEEGSLKYLVLPETDAETGNGLPAYPANSPVYQNGATSYAASTERNAKESAITKYLNDKYNQIYDELQQGDKYTFDNFVEGDCNRLARSAGMAIADRPGISAFNPLLLYGGVGLGKTHLVRAIGNYIREHHTDKKVLYAPSDKFFNQFVDFIKNQDMQGFTNFYANVDVLIIDDVQFLKGKEKTQEIFFHIFNNLHQARKQIIMTSDCAPRELQGLEERLLSRFKWGVTADLKQPDLETRMAIIQKKLQDEQSVFISDEIIEYLANSVDSNVRELEGAINSLIAQASLNKTEVTMSVAKSTVQQIVQFTGNKEINIDEIQKSVGDYLGVSVEEMKSKTRKKEFVLARQIAMYLSKEYTEFSLKSIGYHFGGRDHSTVIHAITSISDYLEERQDVRNYIEDIRKLLKK